MEEGVHSGPDRLAAQEPHTSAEPSAAWPPLSDRTLAVLERSMGSRVLEALKRGEGVVVYPENLNRIVADAERSEVTATGDELGPGTPS